MKAKVKKWKELYGEIIKVKSEEEVAYLKKPSVAIIQEYKELKEIDIYKGLELLFDKCVLEEKEYEDEFKLSVSKSLLNKLPKAHESTIDKETGVDEIKKSAALVRYFFHVDPYVLSIDEFYKLVGEALWIQDYKNKQMEVALANVLVRTLANNTNY